MGNYCGNSKYVSLQKQSLKLKSKYLFQNQIGKGNVAKVKLIQNKFTKKQFAVKIFDKIDVFNRKCIKEVIKERRILINNKESDFLVYLEQAFQDREKLYLVLSNMPYGNLRKLMAKKKIFDQDQARFIIINILLGLETLRRREIVHRDIKPENVLIDSDCYFKIGDFSCADFVTHLPNKKLGGSIGYSAPQLQNKTEDHYVTDYYSVGVILYEMIYGDRKINQFLERLSDQQSQNSQDTQKISDQCIDFICQMTEFDHTNRIGRHFMKEIWKHPWINLSNERKLQFQQRRIESAAYNSLKNFISQNLQNSSSGISVDDVKFTQISDQQLINNFLLQEDKIQSTNAINSDLFSEYRYYHAQT